MGSIITGSKLKLSPLLSWPTCHSRRILKSKLKWVCLNLCRKIGKMLILSPSCHSQSLHILPWFFKLLSFLYFFFPWFAQIKLSSSTSHFIFTTFMILIYILIFFSSLVLYYFYVINLPISSWRDMITTQNSSYTMK